MTRQEIRAKACEILGRFLKRPISPDEKVERRSEVLWDSLRHLELVFALEDVFGLRFEVSELPMLDSLESITAIVGRHIEA